MYVCVCVRVCVHVCLEFGSITLLRRFDLDIVTLTNC